MRFQHYDIKYHFHFYPVMHQPTCFNSWPILLQFFLYNLFSLYNVTCIYFFQELLMTVLPNQLNKTISLIFSFPYLLVVMCVILQSHELSHLMYPCILVSSLFGSCSGSHDGNTSWMQFLTILGDNLTAFFLLFQCLQTF